MRKKTYYGEPVEKPERKKLKDLIGLSGWDIFKGGTGLLAGGCASAVAHRYLVAAVPKGSKPIEKVVIAVGVYFVTGLVGHTVEQYVLGELEDLKTSVSTAQAAIEQEGAADGRNG